MSTIVPVVDASVSEIRLRIEGPAEGKDRPRFNPFMKQVYTTKKTTTGEREIRAAWEEQGKPRLPDESALGLSVSIAVVRPGGHFKKDGSLSAEGERNPVPRKQKPDLDNAVKLIMDALNGRAYRDDVRVAQLHMWRSWAEWPFTEIRLFTVDGTQQNSLESSALRP